MADQSERLVVTDLRQVFSAPDGSELVVLDGVSFEVEPGQTVSIVGPSGSGKSTLLNVIGALEKPSSGRVMLGTTDVTALDGHELSVYRASRVGFVFQEHHLLPQLTALENVLLPTLSGVAGAADEDAARGLLERVGLAARMASFPARLSGGERQRVAVARALINAPGLLLCDEPTGNLDRQTGDSVVELLADMASAEGVTVLMVTHNLEHARRFGTALQLLDGRLIPLDAPDREGGAQ